MKVADLRTLSSEQRQQVVGLMLDTWPDHYGPQGAGDTAAAVVARVDTSALPCGLAAITDNLVIGTCALASRSFGANQDEAPWLIGLAVVPQHRNAGIATALVQAVEAQAVGSGYDQIWTTTQMARPVFVRRGWSDVRLLNEGDGDWHVMTKHLSA